MKNILPELHSIASDLDKKGYISISNQIETLMIAIANDQSLNKDFLHEIFSDLVYKADRDGIDLDWEGHTSLTGLTVINGHKCYINVSADDNQANITVNFDNRTEETSVPLDLQADQGMVATRILDTINDIIDNIL